MSNGVYICGPCGGLADDDNPCDCVHALTEAAARADERKKVLAKVLSLLDSHMPGQLAAELRRDINRLSK